ncbi:unnamed protein product [Amoebophrya sp. A25]|nr:unnamed protein product [Amoebophrya sp. A25]|eukprot:GSA25T00015474001.1
MSISNIEQGQQEQQVAPPQSRSLKYLGLWPPDHMKAKGEFHASGHEFEKMKLRLKDAEWVKTVEWFRAYSVAVVKKSGSGDAPDSSGGTSTSGERNRNRNPTSVSSTSSTSRSPAVNALDTLTGTPFDKYAASASYLILTEKVLKKMREALRIAISKDHTGSGLSKEVLLSDNVAFKNRKFIVPTPIPIEKSSSSGRDDNMINIFDEIELELFAKDHSYRSLVTEARALLLLAEMGLEWEMKGVPRVLYDRTLISAEFWPLWKLLSNIERTGAVTRHYSKMLPEKRLVDLKRMQQTNALTRVESIKNTIDEHEDNKVDVDATTRTRVAGVLPQLSSALPAQKVAHVAFSGNQDQVPGIVASINSLIVNTRHPENVVLHFFLTKDDLAVLMNVFACSFKAKWYREFERAGGSTSDSDTTPSCSGSATSEETGASGETDVRSADLSSSAFEMILDTDETIALDLRDLMLEGDAIVEVLDGHGGNSYSKAANRNNVFSIGDIRMLNTFLRTDGSEVGELLCKHATFLLYGRTRLKLHLFHPQELAHFISPDAHNSNHGNLTAPHNYVRFSLPRRLEKVRLHSTSPSRAAANEIEIISVDKILYLDVDLIVQGDVTEILVADDALHEESHTRDGTSTVRSIRSSLHIAPIAAVPRPNPLSTFLYNWDHEKARHWQPVFSTPSFNAGVMLFDLELWRRLDLETDLSDNVFRVSNEHGRYWRLGSQPPLLSHFLDSWSSSASRSASSSRSSSSTPRNENKQPTEADGVEDSRSLAEEDKTGTLKTPSSSASVEDSASASVLSRRVRFLGPEWNVEGLGHHCQSSFFDKDECLTKMRRKIATGKILHWTGPNKPWIHVDNQFDFNSKFMNTTMMATPNKDGDASADHGFYKSIWDQYATHCWF